MGDDLLNLVDGIRSTRIELPLKESAKDHGIQIDDDPSRQGPLLRKKKGKLESNLDHPKEFEPITTKRWSICRVPAHVREVDEKAYDPKIVSIGPIHHNKPSLAAMETQKLRFLNRLLQHVILRKVDLEDAMKELEGKTRECYSQLFNDMDSNDFVQMMIVDSCFIVELLRLFEMSNKGLDVEEPIFGTRWMLSIIGRDLLNLENQLPMFVLKTMSDLVRGFSTQTIITPLNKLALHFFEPLRLGRDKLPNEKLNSTQDMKHQHLLDLFQSSFIPSPDIKLKKRWSSDDDKLPGKGWVNNATKLCHAGITLERKSGYLLDLEFKDSVLKIPTLFLDDGTGPLLRNLLAYEQSNRYAKPYFTCLAVLLDSIVDTTNDANILRHAGIIKQSKGGNDEIVDLLNSLTKELEFDIEDCYISPEIEEINYKCRSRKARIRIAIRLILSLVDPLSFLVGFISLLVTVLLFS
ncbi:hypothetical protein FNV43_RR15051 [Rhamnella rubrinervis]|uniref:Uncharacterized protein n=1 Tax=Rhamnella rubrinervis TaxID=2594499 RepID=A0A8K0E154_9ROSA|nr:hypothetical protein FNV43_RR15051 [Rhamnella rubrinervis]